MTTTTDILAHLGDPAEPEYFKKDDHLGRLMLLIDPTVETADSQYGTKEMVKTALLVTIPEGDHPLGHWSDQGIYGAALVSAVKHTDARIVMGRLGKGEARSGQSAPYILEKLDEGDRAIVEAFVTHHLAISAEGEFFLKNLDE